MKKQAHESVASRYAPDEIEAIPGVSSSRQLLAHHREVRAGRVKLLVPAALVVFGPFLCGLSAVAGWEPGRVERPLTEEERQVHLAVGEEPPATYAVPTEVFGTKGWLMLGIGGVVALVGGAVLAYRWSKKRRLSRDVPALVTWLRDAPDTVAAARLEWRGMAGLSGKYVYGYAVPVLVCESQAGERSELEVPKSEVDEVLRAVRHRLPHLSIERPETPSMAA